VILCSGKVAFDLIEARDAAGITDTQIVRIEQIYPFPASRWRRVWRRCPIWKRWCGARKSPRTTVPGSLSSR
jgi:2-oxoglutarate dehydrogenase E1 component